MSEQQQVGLCLIATRKYKQFVPDLVEGVKKYFLPNHKVKIFLFDDEYMKDIEGDERVTIQQYPIPSYQFPFATLYRYKIFFEHVWQLSKMDYIFYSDADMAIVDEVKDVDILCDGLTVVFHPGFFSKRETIGHWGSNGVVKESTAWVSPEKRSGYVAGGFNGGRTKEFIEMCDKLDANISEDERIGTIAEHNDESHLNAYLKNVYTGGLLKLSPSWCMVEQANLRKAWGIEKYNPIIVALAKDHKSVRS